MKNLLNSLFLLLASSQIWPPCMAQTPSDKQIQQIETLMAPQRKKLMDVLEADKTGQFARYKSDLEAIAKESDPAKRNALCAKLDRDHLPFIRKSFSKAVVNHEEMKREVTRILGHSNFTFGEFCDILIEFTPPSLALPEKFDAELVCPMEAEEFTEIPGGFAECIAQGGNCFHNVQCIAEVAGGCRGKTSLGQNFTVPEGTYNKITVVNRIDYDYEGWVFALAGYAQVNVKYGVRFKAPGMDKIVNTKEVFALAPLIWYMHPNGRANDFTSQATFTGSFPQGTVVTAQSYLEGFAFSVPIMSLTIMYAHVSNVDSIRLDGSN